MQNSHIAILAIFSIVAFTAISIIPLFGENVGGRAMEQIRVEAPSLQYSSSQQAVCEPVLQWEWVGAVENPRHPRPCTNPVVVQLTDDNSDGLVNGDDRPDVAFINSRKTEPDEYLSEAEITIVDGATGNIHFVIDTPQISEDSNIASADIDSDGFNEIIAVKRQDQWGSLYKLVAFEHDGTLKWESQYIPDQDPGRVPTDYAWGGIGIADFDQDGNPEIYVGDVVFNNDGTVKWDGSMSQGYFRNRKPISNAVDIRPDIPGLELLAGNTLYSSNGGVVWHNADLGDGFTGVGNFDSDSDAEIVLVYSRATPLTARLALLDHLGNPIGNEYTISNEPGFPSKPLLTNLDRDPEPEVVLIWFGIGNLNTMFAFDWVCDRFQVKWVGPTVMDVSGWSMPMAYDFNDDGISEIVHHDEKNWYIIDGQSGNILYSQPFLHATLIDTPVVANIDSDDYTEILVFGCVGYGFAGDNILKAYECKNECPLSRAIWNQYSYHISNVNDDGSIPQFEELPWLTHNSWIEQQEYTCAVCGNGIIENIEECDDGNNENGDGCSAICTNETKELPFRCNNLRPMLKTCEELGGVLLPWDRVRENPGLCPTPVPSKESVEDPTLVCCISP